MSEPPVAPPPQGGVFRPGQVIVAAKPLKSLTIFNDLASLTTLVSHDAPPPVVWGAPPPPVVWGESRVAPMHQMIENHMEF